MGENHRGYGDGAPTVQRRNVAGLRGTHRELKCLSGEFPCIVFLCAAILGNNRPAATVLPRMFLPELRAIALFAILSSPAAARLEFDAPAGDPYADRIRDVAVASQKEVEQFFGRPYPDTIHFQMVADRAAFDAAAARFGMSPTQCWMVGLGTGDLLILLSPNDWKKQACEHDPADMPATRQLITHEMVHVFHGQFNSSRDFSGMDDLDWFVEGLAVLASGQLTKERSERMKAAVAKGEAPTSLSKVWTGPDRYAFAGSLVGYVDRTWGRAMTLRLLTVRNTAEALALLEKSGASLLAGWKS